MSKDIILCEKLDPEAKIPTRKFPTDAGMDVYALEETIVPPHAIKVVRTGVTCNFPEKTVIFGWPKSRSDFLVGAGVIDHGYQGEILVKVTNILDKPLTIKKHQGIAQLVIVPFICPIIEEAENIHIKKTERGVTGGIVGNSK